MVVKLALLADYANVTADGKLNIMGIFDRIFVTQLPAVHPVMQFIVRLEARSSERDRTHGIEVRLLDPDGGVVVQLEGEMVPRGTRPGEAVSANQIITLTNLQLTKRGEHTFVVFVDNDLKAEVPLHVEQGVRPLTDPSSAQPN